LFIVPKQAVPDLPITAAFGNPKGDSISTGGDARRVEKFRNGFSLVFGPQGGIKKFFTLQGSHFLIGNFLSRRIGFEISVLINTRATLINARAIWINT
jgi:hypothetical protein